MSPGNHHDVQNKSRHPGGNSCPRFGDNADPQLLLLFSKDIQKYKRHQDLWEAVADLIRRCLHAAGGGIMILEQDKQHFFVPAVSLEDTDMEGRFKTTRFFAGKSPFAQLFPTGAASVVNDFKHPPHPFRQMDARIRDYTINRLDVPLRIKDTIVGTLWAINRKETDFDATAILMMDALAGMTGSAMEGMRIDVQLNLSDQREKQYRMTRTYVIHHLAHAIKTPLSVSIASLKLLGKHLRNLPDPAWQRIYHRAERNLDRLLTLEYEMEDILRQHEPPKNEPASFPSGEPFSIGTIATADPHEPK